MNKTFWREVALWVVAVVGAHLIVWGFGMLVGMGVVAAGMLMSVMVTFSFQLVIDMWATAWFIPRVMAAVFMLVWWSIEITILMDKRDCDGGLIKAAHDDMSDWLEKRAK